MPKFSIISPVYNVEKYLNRCIDSILAQFNQDWELILVDDGSKDNSGQICDEYAETDSRIKVIHKINGGVSTARNFGVEESKGEWVLFVDADDYLEPDLLSIVSETVNKYSSDMIVYCTKEVIDEKEQINHIYPLTPNKIYNKQEVEQQLIPYACNGSSFVNAVWNKAYRRDVIQKNHLFFQNRVMGEDWLFNVEYLQCINSATFTDEVLYNYMRNGESATSKYIPEQFQLWTENWQTKMELIYKYNLDVDINHMKREMCTKFYYFIREVRGNENEESAILKIKAISNSELMNTILNAIPINIREWRVWLSLMFLRIKVLL